MSTVPKQRQQRSPLATQASLSRVIITGDLLLSVTESDAAHGPIKGSYSIEMEEMREPLKASWSAEGQARSLQARATDIAFEMPAARAVQTWLDYVQAECAC